MRSLNAEQSAKWMEKGNILDSGKDGELLDKSDAYKNFYEKHIKK